MSVVRIFKELQKELNLYSELNYHPSSMNTDIQNIVKPKTSNGNTADKIQDAVSASLSSVMI